MRVGPERSEGPYRIASERFTNILSTWFTREIKWGWKKPMNVLYYYYQNPNIIKFNELMSTHKKKMLGKLCFFIVKIYDAVCTHNP